MPYTQERLRSRHPFQVFMLLTSAFYAVAGAINRDARPGSVQESVGHVGTIVWLAFLGFGSVAALVGIFLKDRATGLYCEQVGLFAAGLSTLFYAAVAIYTIGGSAAASASVLIGFGTSCLVRSWQLHRILTRAIQGRSRPNMGE